jgi:acyl-CoA hydrolase
MQNNLPLHLTSADECVERIIEAVGNRIVLALPLGLGKPCQIANALYQRALLDPHIQLNILTALHIERPNPTSDLEKRFVEPILERIFGDYPGFEYLSAIRSNSLPANVEVAEFYLSPGKFLNNVVQQQNYISSNYTHAARDLAALGVNVLAQLICEKKLDGKSWYSLSCNPDLTLDLIEMMKEKAQQGHKSIIVAQINKNLPFMYHDAMLDPASFDIVVENPTYDFTLPAPPNPSVAAADHMIGLLASSLVKDGGTLQIGIGSLGDAIVNGILLRHRQNDVYRDMLSDFGIAGNFAAEIENMGGMEPFDQGLYGASEMFISGFLELYKAGILKRRVYPDLKIQRLVNEGLLEADLSAKTLSALLEAGAIKPLLSQQDFNWLQQFGIFKDSLTYDNGEIGVSAEIRIRVDLSDPENFDLVVHHCLGSNLKGGIVMHGGFFLGPRDFYDSLNAMDEEERKNFCMTSVMFVNQLYGQHELATLQRTHARFINTTMMNTLTGAACSDGLEDGQMVSGVGGQYNFVAMAHELPGGRSLLALRSTRSKNGKVTSNIVSHYGNLTIPRHLRDVVVTEYGIADLRGKQDKTVIAALLNITDSRFQQELMEKMKAAGKLPQDHQIPEAFQNNFPERLTSLMGKYKEMGYFQTFPFGVDMTDVELVLARILKTLKSRMSGPTGVIGSIKQAIATHTIPEAATPYLERMQLLDPQTLQDKMLRKLIVGVLTSEGHI